MFLHAYYLNYLTYHNLRDATSCCCLILQFFFYHVTFYVFISVSPNKLKVSKGDHILYVTFPSAFSPMPGIWWALNKCLVQ